MPGQEKMVKEYYEKNPSALSSMRGSIYEEKIIEKIKENATVNKIEISKEQAEKILKEENEKNLKAQEKIIPKEKETDIKSKVKTKTSDKKIKINKKPKTDPKKTKKVKKVSKK